MKFIKRAGAILVVAAAITIAAPAAAHATTLYDNNNYSTQLWTGTSTGTSGVPVSANDKTSSFRNVGSETYCENANCSGRKLVWSGDANALGAISSGLNFGETWSDRISGVL